MILLAIYGHIFSLKLSSRIKWAFNYWSHLFCKDAKAIFGIFGIWVRFRIFIIKKIVAFELSLKNCLFTLFRLVKFFFNELLCWKKELLNFSNWRNELLFFSRCSWWFWLRLTIFIKFRLFLSSWSSRFSNFFGRFIWIYFFSNLFYIYSPLLFFISHQIRNIDLPVRIILFFFVKIWVKCTWLCSLFWTSFSPTTRLLILFWFSRLLTFRLCLGFSFLYRRFFAL